MEFLWRHPHDLARMQYVREAGQPSSSLSPRSLSPRKLSTLHRRLLVATAIFIFLAQVLVLTFFHSQQEGRFLSNLLQFILGVLAFLAMLDAGKRSQRTARRVWYYAAAAVGTYTAGQLLMVGYLLFDRGPFFAPRITDQFFFFWIVPLLAAGAIAQSSREDGFDSTVLLDFTQFMVLALAMHFSVLGDASRWQSNLRQMEWLEVKLRILRDVLVLGWLGSRAWLASSRQLRGLLMRLGAFYLLYSIVDAIYLSAEAAWLMLPGTWFDLLWSLPRIAAVVLALTWNWRDEVDVKSASERRSRLFSRMTPVIVPLAVLAISFRTFSRSPMVWETLILASFVTASLRLLMMQSRQERTLADLHDSHELLHSIIEGTSEAIYLKDPNGRYRLINTAGANYLGLTAKDILGKTDRDLLSPETLGPILKIDQEVLNKGESVTCEETLIEKGATRTFLSTKNPYRDSHGRITGVLGISVEISERRRMEEQFRRAQRMDSIGAFSGAIAHDFNNLLTIIKGYSQLTQTGLQDSPALQGNLDQIVRASDRATALIRQLLAFSRQQVLEPRVISLNHIISHLQKMLQRLIGEGITITTHFASELWPVKADPGQIEQVLMNLAANARDAMPQGGTLTLATANVHLDEAFARSHANVLAGDYAMFSVADTGIGMSAHTLVRIFEPFFTTKPAGQGTGLGLATTYGIVKQSGGYIGVESEIGAGTFFKIYLPRVDQPIDYQIEGPDLNG